MRHRWDVQEALDGSQGINRIHTGLRGTGSEHPGAGQGPQVDEDTTRCVRKFRDQVGGSIGGLELQAKDFGKNIVN